MHPRFVVCPYCETSVRVSPKYGLVRKHRRQGRTCLGSYRHESGFPLAPDHVDSTPESEQQESMNRIAQEVELLIPQLEERIASTEDYIEEREALGHPAPDLRFRLRSLQSELINRLSQIKEEEQTP